MTGLISSHVGIMTVSHILGLVEHIVDVRQGTWWAENAMLRVSKSSHLGKWLVFILRIRLNT
jgi:hypothetical protein